ncbi:MAG: helicase-exonuclease AddAB subunit AddA, partial [Clostridia bacterium]|nr:helicase-exonuclease AddAB subunit AddA [Clostridia bacterium]
MGALEGGEEAQANLRLLYERAGAYEKSGFRGIFNFIRYVEKMERRREDIEGAQLVNANHNVVRVMTIHKSKGLEFPIVFLTRLTKHITYTFPKEEKRVVMNNELGIAADYFNYEEMYNRKLTYKGYVKAANKREL